MHGHMTTHHGLQQLSQRDPESGGNPRHVQDRQVAASAFDTRHIGAIDCRQVSQSLLGQYPLLSEQTNRDAEVVENWVRGSRNAVMIFAIRQESVDDRPQASVEHGMWI